MAVKARNRKRIESEERNKKAVKIKCCYCDSKETCQFRERKEKSENRGITTLCTLTPNVIVKKKKKAKNVFTEKYGSDSKVAPKNYKKPFKKSQAPKNKGLQFN